MIWSHRNNRIASYSVCPRPHTCSGVEPSRPFPIDTQHIAVNERQITIRTNQFVMLMFDVRFIQGFLSVFVLEMAIFCQNSNGAPSHQITKHVHVFGLVISESHKFIDEIGCYLLFEELWRRAI